MWFGTQDGLNRYDGYEFKQFRKEPFNPNSLSHEHVFCLAKGKNQVIWTGTFNGLNQINTQTLAIKRIKEFEGESIFSITEGVSQSLYLATLEHVFSFKNGSKKELIASLEGKKILKTDRNQQTYLSHGKTLYLIENQVNKLRVVCSFPEDIIDFFIDKAGGLWILTSQSVYFGATETGISTPQKSTRIFIDSKGLLWIGTMKGGVFLYDASSGKFLKQLQLVSNKNTIHNSTVSAIYEGSNANEDLVWIGTREAGVFKYSRSKNNFTHWHKRIKETDTQTKTFLSISQSPQNTLWTGTLNGLVELGENSSKIHQISSKNPRSNQIQALLHDSKGNFWIGTNAGLYRKVGHQFVPCKLPQITPNHPTIVFKIYEDDQKHIWVATNGLLIEIENEKVLRVLNQVRIKGKNIPFKFIGDIKQDAQKNYWIATTNGLFLKDKNGQFQHFSYSPSNRKGLMDDVILSLIITQKQDVWICTFKGISKVISGKNQYTFRHFNGQNGLPNSVVYGGLEDDKGRLWLSTNRGISCMDTQHEKFQNFTADDGLSIHEFNSGAFYRNQAGVLFFGGLGALISFSSNQSILNHHLPHTIISSLSVNGKEVPIDSLLNKDNTLHFGYNENFISLKLAATDFTNSAQNQFAYQFPGKKKNWIYLENQREISFANLPHGEYELSLKAANNHGIWNDNEIVRIRLVVSPPLWRTWWFYGLIASLLVGLTYLMYQFRINQLLAIEKAKIEENDRVRKLAAQDIHDEFGNSLTRISLLTELIKSNLKKQNTEEAFLYLSKIYDTSQRIYQGTKDFIWAINPEHDNLFEVAIRIKDYCEEVLDKTKIRFDCEGIDNDWKNVKLLSGQSRQIVMIFKEAITNSMKHSEASLMKLCFETKDTRHYIIWQDFGVGYKTETKNGHGLKNMQTRANQIKANFFTENVINQGVKICLEIGS